MSGIQDDFRVIKADIANSFFHIVLVSGSDDQSASLQVLMDLPVNFGGIGIFNPISTADYHNTTTSSSSCTSILSNASIANNGE